MIDITFQRSILLNVLEIILILLIIAETWFTAKAFRYDDELKWLFGIMIACCWIGLFAALNFNYHFINILVV